jgi:hypothetical protein
MHPASEQGSISKDSDRDGSLFIRINPFLAITRKKVENWDAVSVHLFLSILKKPIIGTNNKCAANEAVIVRIKEHNISERFNSRN